MPIYSRKRTHSGGMAEFEQPGKPTLDIPVEILLKIVEEMGWDPISIGLFMRTSTATALAILNHETSLSVHFTKDLPPHNYNPTILTSAPTSRTYIDPRPIQSVLRKLLSSYIPRLPQFPSLTQFTKTFQSAMSYYHPTIHVTVDVNTVAQRAYDVARQTLDQNAQLLDSGYGAEAPRQPFYPRPKAAKLVDPGTFEWVEELHLRQKIKDFLPGSSLFDLKRPEIQAVLQTNPTLCHSCHSEALEVFKAKGIDLLYSMWDARCELSLPITKAPCKKGGCEEKVECEARDNVESWIMRQGAGQLACLLQTIWIASQLYDYTRRWPRAGISSGCEHGWHDASSDATMSAAERDHRWELVERQCIFREMCLESGPYFLYCSRVLPAGYENNDIEEVEWVRQRMERGVSRLHAYEAGAPLPDDEASDLYSNTAQAGGGVMQAPPTPRKTLQATILQRFCELRQTDLRHGWDEVFYVNAHEVDALKKRLDLAKEITERAKKLERREKETLQWEKRKLVEEEKKNNELIGEQDRNDSFKENNANVKRKGYEDEDEDNGMNKKGRPIVMRSDEEDGECVFDEVLWKGVAGLR